MCVGRFPQERQHGLVHGKHTEDVRLPDGADLVQRNLAGTGEFGKLLVRSDIDAEELLWTVATMCRGPYGEKPAYAGKMVDVLIDGLRYGAHP